MSGRKALPSFALLALVALGSALAAAPVAGESPFADPGGAADRRDLAAVEPLHAWWVPVVSHASGTGGSQWRSDLGLLNPSTTATAHASLRLHTGGTPVLRSAEVGPLAQVVLPDVVDQMGWAGSAALEVRSDVPLYVTSRTYNLAAAGTFGQGLDGVGVLEGAAAGQVLYLPQLAEDAASRTNIGLANAGTVAARAAVELFNGGAQKVGAYSVSLEPGQWKQETRPFARLAGQSSMTRGWARVTVNAGFGVLAVASVIDAATGDPTTVVARIAGQAGCYHALEPSATAFGADGGTGTVAVTAPAGCPWAATSNAAWLTVTSGSSGNGSGAVAFRVAPNDSSTARTGALTVAGQAVTVAQAAARNPSEVTVYLGPGQTVPLVLVKVPGGTFAMGSPEDEPGSEGDELPQHQVTLSQGYYLGKTEVTQAQWRAVMGTSPSPECGGYGVGDDLPVYCVSWNSVCGGATGSGCTATSFVGRLNALLGTTDLRLPSEAEWERAARGGASTPFSFATPPTWDAFCGSFPEAEPHMWWCGNAGPTAQPVGTRQANPYGLFDMHGNVQELVGDWYGLYPETAQTDPTGPASGSLRVIRGGGWDRTARSCRSAVRQGGAPFARMYNVGFRLARPLQE